MDDDLLHNTEDEADEDFGITVPKKKKDIDPLGDHPHDLDDEPISLEEEVEKEDEEDLLSDSYDDEDPW